MNQLVAQHLRQIATIYQIQDEKWRVSACNRAADCVEVFHDPITEDNVCDIDNVGKSMGKTILEFLASGTSQKYQQLAEEVDPQCLTMLVVKGIGPKTAWNFYQSGVQNFDQLVNAWESGLIDERFDAAMRQAIATKGERVEHYIAKRMGVALLGLMQQQEGVIRASLAGSVRRKKETCKDLDLLISAKAKDRPAIIRAFTRFGTVINEGSTKASIWFAFRGYTLQADLLVVPDNSFGAALQYFTGSREHNIELRSMAQKMGYKVNEKGIFKDKKKVGGKNEEDIYSILGISMPEPENR